MSLSHTLEHNEECVHALCFLGETLLVTGARDGNARIWDLRDGKCVKTLLGHSNPICAVAVSEDERTLVAHSFDAVACVWDLETGVTLRSFTTPTPDLWCVAVSPDARKIATGSKDAVVRVWDVASGKQVHTLEGHTDHVNKIAILGDMLVSGSWDHTARVWDLRSGECVRELFHDTFVSAVAISVQGLVVTGQLGDTVRLWVISTADFVQAPCGHTKEISALCISGDGRIVFSSYVKQPVCRWNTRTGAWHEINLQGKNDISRLALSKDGRTLVTGDWQGFARVWDLTPPEMYTVAALFSERFLGMEGGHPLQRFIRRDGDHAVMTRVVEFLI